MIKAKKISKIYFTDKIETNALFETTLEIKKGEFVAIIGKSGAGKSTLVNQLSLLDTPTRGRIFIYGKDTSKLSKKEKTALRLRKMGFVFQDYALLPELNAWQNVSLPMMMGGLPKVKAKEKSLGVLSRLELAEKVNNLPSQLSGGEQQRVSIARAIAHKPDILFADEPTANLDSKTSKIILDYLRELNQEGITIVMVTHEKEYAKEAKRIIEISDGAIIKDQVN